MPAEARTYTHSIDWDRLRGLLDDAIELRGKSRREAAEEMGISPSTLHRIWSGDGVMADTLAAVLGWLYEVPPMWIRRTTPPAVPVVSAVEVGAVDRGGV